MTTGPVLLLDVDGVLSPYSSTFATWGDWVQPEGVKMRLPLSRTMGTALLETGCAIEWLTTWGEEANRLIAPHLGWPAKRVWRRLEVPGGVTVSVDGPNGWWKWRWAQVRSASGEPLIWVDDEIARRRLEDPRIDEWLDGLEQPILLVSCDPYVGLTEADILEITEFVATVNAR